MRNLKISLHLETKYVESRANYDLTFNTDRAGYYLNFYLNNVRFAREGILEFKGGRYRGLLLGLHICELFFEKVKTEQFLFYFEPILRGFSKEYSTNKPNKRLISLIRNGAYTCPFCDGYGKQDWIRKIQGKAIFFSHAGNSIRHVDESNYIGRIHDRVSESVIINKPTLDHELAETICDHCLGAGYVYNNLNPEHINYKRTTPIIVGTIPVYKSFLWPPHFSQDELKWLPSTEVHKIKYMSVALEKTD